MVTVEVDAVRVESRLAGGELSCPSCPDGVLAGWGFARSRRVVGLVDPVRPRRSRCRGCAVTHVLLPVSLLLRRAYAAEVIWAVLKAKAAGGGYRRIAAAVGIPACTVRRWLRVMGRRAEAVRQWFLGVAVAAGVDVSIPAATGTAVGDVLAAVGAARLAMVSRFGCGVGGAAARGCRIGHCSTTAPQSTAGRFEGHDVHRRAKRVFRRRFANDTDVTAETAVINEVTADPTLGEAPAMTTASAYSGTGASPESEGPAAEREPGTARKPLVTRAQAEQLVRSAATALGAVGKAVTGVARFGAGAVRGGWLTFRAVPPAVRRFALAAILMLLGIVGAIVTRNLLGLVCIVVVIPVCASVLGALAHRWFVDSGTTVQPHAMGPAEASTAALERSVRYIDGKLALALTSMGTDHHQQAVVALFQAKTAVELTLGTEQDSPGYDVALRSDDYGLNPRAQSRSTPNSVLRESNSRAAS